MEKIVLINWDKIETIYKTEGFCGVWGYPHWQKTHKQEIGYVKKDFCIKRYLTTKDGMNLQATGIYILLKRLPEEAKQGVLIIPEVKKKTPLCEVKSVGDLVKLAIADGDLVMVNQHSGYEIEHEGQLYYLVKELEILARITA